MIRPSPGGIAAGLLIAALVGFVVHGRREIGGLRLELTKARMETTVDIRSTREAAMAASAPDPKMDRAAPTGRAAGAFPLHNGPPGSNDEYLLSCARRNVQQQYGALLDSLGLPPERLGKVKELLVERALVSADVDSVARRLQTNLGTAELQELVDGQDRQIDRELQAAAAGPAYAEVAAMVAAGGSFRELQSDFATDAAFNGSPVSPDQLVQLAGIMADAEKGIDPATLAQRIAEPPDPVSGVNSLNAEAYRKARSILTAEQLECFRQYLANKR